MSSNYPTTGTVNLAYYESGEFKTDFAEGAVSVLTYTPSTGLKINASKLSFYGASPVSKPASSSQAAVTGTAGDVYTATEKAMLNDLKTLANALRDALVQLGLIKGSA